MRTSKSYLTPSWSCWSVEFLPDSAHLFPDRIRANKAPPNQEEYRPLGPEIRAHATFRAVQPRRTLDAPGSYTYRFNERTSISLYEELIHKSWEDEDDGGIIIPKRTDWLFLSSSFLKFKWKSNLNIKTRYLFRMNASTSDVEDYFDHIIFVGPEYTF